MLRQAQLLSLLRMILIGPTLLTVYNTTLI